MFVFYLLLRSVKYYGLLKIQRIETTFTPTNIFLSVVRIEAASVAYE